MKIDGFKLPNRIYNKYIDFTGIKRKIIDLMQTIPRVPRIECKDAVARMIKEWLHMKLPPVISYTGGFFERKEIDERFLYHSVAVIKTDSKYFIADPTYYLFKPEQTWLLVETEPNETKLLETLHQIYGGKWWAM